MKNLRLALSLAMLIAISTTNSFANTKTKFAPIVDASQMNMAAVNRLSAVKPESEGSSHIIGSIVPWMFEKSNPLDLDCPDFATGGTESGGTCKWLECNGQAVNPTVYPEYVQVTGATTIPDFRGLIPTGRKTTETASNAYKSVEVEIPYIMRAYYDFNSPDNSLDGMWIGNTYPDSFSSKQLLELHGCFVPQRTMDSLIVKPVNVLLELHL